MKKIIVVILKNVDSVSVMDILCTAPELTFVSEKIERYFRKRFPSFVESVAARLDAWCVGPVDEDGWHPTVFEGMFLVLTFAYMIPRMLLIIFLPIFAMIALFGLLFF